MKTDGVSPARLVEMLADRFGAFEALAGSSIKLARFVPPDELPMDPLVADAVLEFGQDLRDARDAAEAWATNSRRRPVGRTEGNGGATAAPEEVARR
jgi:hypothetical protein